MHLTKEEGGGRRGIKEKVIEYMLHESRKKGLFESRNRTTKSYYKEYGWEGRHLKRIMNKNKLK